MRGNMKVIFIAIFIGLFLQCAAGMKLEKNGAEDSYRKDVEEMKPMPEEAASGVSDSESKSLEPSKKKESAKKPGGNASGLKAGFADDNKQFSYYQDFVNKNKNYIQHLPLNTSERIHFIIKNKNDRSVFGARLKVYAGETLLEEGKTHTDGSFNFYPSLYSRSYKSYTVSVSYQQTEDRLDFSRDGKREIEMKLNTSSVSDMNPAMDILFIFDTTGSMGEEIERLKNTIEIIYLNLSASKQLGKLRFGMVLYKDVNDSYRTKVIPLTSELRKFQHELDKVTADGGGDIPEDLQQAMDDSIRKVNWDDSAIKLSFIITDAPLQLRYKTDYTYIQAIKDAKKKAIKYHSIGTGGLPLSGEFVLRQISQYTQGRYIFLTYGEKGESEGGQVGSVSHHTGANYKTDKLESIIMAFAREELKNLSGKSDDTGEYYSAVLQENDKKEDVLEEVFSKGINQLIDYSSVAIPKETKVAILPLHPSADKNSEYFTERILLSMRNSGKMQIIERSQLIQILNEQKLSLSGVIDESTGAKIGKLLGADVLLLGKVYKKKKEYEVFLRFIRTETGEILSVTRLVLDQKLGL